MSKYDLQRAVDPTPQCAGTGDPPEAWLVALPLYAELQRGKAAHTHDHLAYGVPNLWVSTLPARYEDLLQHELPLEHDEIQQLREFAPRFAELCDELAAHDVPESVQHDDLHHANLYVQGERLRVLDWGDASISHPFASLVVTFRFLEEITKLPPGDPGSGGCATRIWNPGVAVLSVRSRSRSALARSRTRSLGRGSGTTSRRRRAPSSTRGSRSCCGGRSHRRADSPPSRSLCLE